MRCFYCKEKLSRDAESDICDICLFHVDDVEQEYDEDIQRDIEAIVNKAGITPARFIE
jgi:hypothetical protein